jgi:hypothetical protein
MPTTYIQPPTYMNLCSNNKVVEGSGTVFHYKLYIWVVPNATSFSFFVGADLSFTRYTSMLILLLGMKARIAARLPTYRGQADMYN